MEWDKKSGISEYDYYHPVNVRDKERYMSRTESLNIRIKPELKKGVKMLFEGQKISDAFELMVGSYIDNKIDMCSVRIKSYESVLKELIYRKAVISEINRMERIVKDLIEEFNYLIEIRSVCFNR